MRYRCGCVVKYLKNGGCNKQKTKVRLDEDECVIWHGMCQRLMILGNFHARLHEISHTNTLFFHNIHELIHSCFVPSILKLCKDAPTLTQFYISCAGFAVLFRSWIFFCVLEVPTRRENSPIFFHNFIKLKNTKKKMSHWMRPNFLLRTKENPISSYYFIYRNLRL